jgi:hypothetical protein
MELIKKIFVLFLCILFLVSCTPTQFIPREMKIHKFESTPIYELNADIILPDKPVKILLDKDFKVTTDAKEAKYIAFAPKEYTKVQGFLKARQAYQEITEEQEKLINTYIQTINALKEYIALQQLKAEEYRQLWADSENAYRAEQHQHKIDNMYHKTIIGVMGLGAIVIAILAL